MRKLILMILSAGAGLFSAAAQVNLELVMDQEQFLPNESLPVAVRITNRSGQQLHLGAEADWLTFSVEAEDGFVVIKKSEVPVTGEFDLENSQMAIKRVDLQPYFTISKPGRYKIIATLRIKDWTVQMASAPKRFDIIRGAEIWSQDFGVPAAPGTAPEARKFALVQANYLKEQLRLSVPAGDPSGAEVYKVSTLGPMVSFAHPEVQLDRESRLNVVWQMGAQTFCFALVNPDGTVARLEYYDTFYSRPRLVVGEDGNVVLLGGTRRAKPGELPVVKAPNELPFVARPPVIPALTNR
jgi:hypothetical protein